MSATDDLGAVIFRRSLANYQRLAQWHKFGVALDVGDEVKHLRCTVRHRRLELEKRGISLDIATC